MYLIFLEYGSNEDNHLQDMLSELLSEYFSDERFSKGFIVDTLASAVLRSPPFALSLVLKCNRSIVNIHLVLCHSEFSKWAMAYEESLKEPEVIEMLVTLE